MGAAAAVCVCQTPAIRVCKTRQRLLERRFREWHRPGICICEAVAAGRGGICICRVSSVQSISTFRPFLPKVSKTASDDFKQTFRLRRRATQICICQASGRPILAVRLSELCICPMRRNQTRSSGRGKTETETNDEAIPGEKESQKRGLRDRIAPPSALPSPITSMSHQHHIQFHSIPSSAHQSIPHILLLSSLIFFPSHLINQSPLVILLFTI